MTDKLHPLAMLLQALSHSGPVDIVPPADVSYLDKLLIDEKGLVRVLPAADLAAVPVDHMRLWCHKRAVYGLPTAELVAWLKNLIGDRSAIEIGSGNGALGRALGIPRTDNRMQEWPEIIAHYGASGQITINYPDDIEKLAALDAITKHRPDVVVASWVTQLYRPDEHERGGNMFGVDEDALLDTGVTYVHIGATGSHQNKRILSRPHEEFRFDWLAGRGAPADRVIWVWRGR